MHWIKKNRRPVAIGSFLLIICLAIGFIWKNSSTAEKSVDDRPLVKTRMVHTSNGARSYQYAGEVRSRYESSLAFQVSGKIISRNVDVGSIVHAGDVLMQIDARDARQTLETCAAQIASAESGYNLARDSLKRCQQLYDQGAISKASLDQAQNGCDTAEATLRQLKAQYALYQNQLQYTTLSADRDGVVTGIYAEVGQVVVAMAAAPTVVTIAENRDLEVAINVPENRLQNLHRAQHIRVSFWALPDVIVEGKVREIAPMADPVAKTFPVCITLIDPPVEVKLGMTATASIQGITEKQSSVAIPLTAVYQTGDAPAVWVVSNGTVNLRKVKLDSFERDQVQVDEGLHDGEQIVIAGVHKLMAGQKVRTEPATLPGGDE